MEKINLNEYLASNEYPGRGIAVAMAPDGRQMFIGYFIMGRSENSRNRVFDPVPERGGICTVAADPAKLEDPSLIIYNPVLTLGKTHIVTNGDQTDTIYDLMSQGKSFADALRVWRMALAAAASLAGLFGLTLGAICLVVHLAGLESFGISYLAPFSGIGGARALLRPRLVREPLRDPLLRPLDRRNQGEKR